MLKPHCPLCGASSTWVYIDFMRPELHNTIPGECKFCKAEDGMHFRQWQQGVDITEHGGKPFNANVEVQPRMARRGNRRGGRVA